MKLKYYLIKTENEISEEDFNNIVSIINTFKGVGITKLEETPNTYNIFFENTDILSQLRFVATEATEKEKENKVTTESIAHTQVTIYPKDLITSHVQRQYTRY